MSIFVNPINISLQEEILRKTVPVVVNSYNQLTYLSNIIEKLRLSGFKNIYIMDQCSTSPDLVDYLVRGNGYSFSVFWSNNNNGPHDFFLSGKFNIFSGLPFLYTDPDLDWECLAPNYLIKLFEISKKYKVFKVGSALLLPNACDLKPGISFKNGRGEFVGVLEHESNFWNIEIELGVYNAPIDTTMHLFVPDLYNEGDSLITGIRVGGDGFSLKHLPWWNDDIMPIQEQSDYLLSATHNSWR